MDERVVFEVTGGVADAGGVDSIDLEYAPHDPVDTETLRSLADHGDGW